MREHLDDSLIRISAFVRKELVGAARQPKLIVFLVLGPFVVLLLFGMGLRDSDPELPAAFVVAPSSPLADEIERFATQQAGRLDVRSIDGDLDSALTDLEQGELQIVMSFPGDVRDTVASGQRALITVHHDIVDPIELRAVRLFAANAVGRVNRLVVAALVDQAQDDADDLTERVEIAQETADNLEAALDRGETSAAILTSARLRQQVTGLAAVAGPTAAILDAFDQAIDPAAFPDGRVRSSIDAAATSAERLDAADEPAARREHLDTLQGDLATLARGLQTFGDVQSRVLVSPYRGTLQSVSDQPLSLTDYYAPAVVAVLLQHMVITFVALSLVQEHRQGTLELFRVAPVRVGELLAGKYLAQMALGMGVAAVLLPTLVVALGVPTQGSWLQVAGVVAATLFASAGLGLLIALLADTEIQAVQYAMMVLLATVFLSGFLLSLERFVPEVGWLAWLLPATYGIRGLREVMLRGRVEDPTMVVVLVAIGIALAAVGWVLLRRRLGRA